MENQELDILQAKGFISAYMHTEDGEFIPTGTEPKQGYYKLNADAVQREMHIKNLIVDMASKFMAKRMRPGASWGAGIQYLELGTGVGSGTTQNPEPESATQTTLRQPLERKDVTSWTYLDGSGQSTASETNVVQLTFVFNESEANNAIVEMGLFGGDATATLSTGYMFNYKTFPVWNKDNTMKLTVVWTLTF